MFVKIGNMEFLKEAYNNVSFKDFYEEVKGKLIGIDAREAYKILTGKTIKSLSGGKVKRSKKKVK
jgi:hypothetical protein